MIARIERVLLLALLVLVWAHASLAAERTVVFTNARVVPMTSETVLEDRAVVVRGSRIAQVVRSKDLRIPEGAEVIDCRGAYLMPGLADMHTHLNDALFPHPFFNLFLANGVTTIRDLAQGSPPAVLAYRREIGSGARLGPHIYAANTYWGWEKDPIAVFRAQQPLGYDCAKINSYFSPEPFDALVREARRAHVYTLGHIPYAVGLEGVLAAGMNEVSHVDELILSEMIGLDHTQSLKQEEWEGLLVERAKETYRPYLQATPDEIERAFGPVAKKVVGRLKGKDLAFTTTLLCDEDIADKLLRREKLETAAHAPYVAPQFWKDLDAGTDRHMKMLAGEERGFLVLYELDRIVLREMKKNGVRLVLGTDVGPTYLSLVPGFAVHDELRILVACGFTPYEALETCTRGASEVCERMTGKNEFGTIEAGKRADLVLVEGNPLADLGAARRPIGVMAAGEWMPRDTLDALLAVLTKDPMETIGAAYTSGGIEAALAAYRDVKAANRRNDYYLSPVHLNNAGYELLGEGKIDDAIRILELNMAEYPEDPNTYDSAGEAHMKKGENDVAIRLYRKSLEMEPRNGNAVKMLGEMGAARTP